MNPQKTEHTGAKNGGGFWGTRKRAKQFSKTKRRQQDKIEAKVQKEEKLIKHTQK